MDKEIIMLVDQNGEIKIETVGFKGASCIKEAAFLEDVLGKELHKDLTPAYFETDPNQSRKKYLNICG